MIEKLKRIKEPLRKWSKESFGNIDNKIRVLEEEMEKNDLLLEANKADEVLLARHCALMSKIDLWCKRKNDFWKQLS